MDDDLLEAAQAAMVRRIKNDRAHDRNMARIAKSKTRPTVDLSNASLHIADDDMTEADLEIVVERAARHGMSVLETAEAIHADMHVMTRIACPWRLAATAALSGAIICNIEYLGSSGHRGAATAFKQATQIKRKVWLSDPFKEEEPQLAADIEHVASRPGAKWSFTDMDTFFTKIARGTKGYEFIGLVSSVMKEDCALATFVLPYEFVS